jgi:hypothetical protein
MSKRDELYQQGINRTKADSIYSDENQIKILLIFTLLFMILTVGYLLYYSTKENGITIRNTKVLGVSYIPDEQKRQKEPIRENKIEFNSRLNTSTVDDKGDYTEVVVVEDKKEFTHVVTVKKSE